MSRSNNGHLSWTQRLGWGVLLLLVVGFLGLMTANAIDYYHYRRAVGCPETLGANGIQQLVEECFAKVRTGPERLEGADIPAAIRPFHPVASVDARAAQFVLYNRGDGAAVYLSVDNDRDNLTAAITSNVKGFYESRTFWTKYPDRYAALHPQNRIVTLAQGSLHSYREWIVVPGRLLMIDRYHPGGEKMMAEVALSQADQKQIERAVAAIAPKIRGRRYTSGASDGVELSIRFKSDGEPGGDELLLANTWREEAAPLIETIAELSPPNFPLTAATYLRLERHGGLDHQTSSTWAERARLEKAPLPWWCWWPRFLPE